MKINIQFKLLFAFIILIYYCTGCIDFREWEGDTESNGITTTKETEDEETILSNNVENEDCSLSNQQIDKWMRETINVNSLLLSAYQSAYELYQNPSDSGKLEALDWQKRTLEAYNFMKEYQSVPLCLNNYHNLQTNMLSELTSTFSEIVLSYVARDTSKDFEPYLNAAKMHLFNAYKISELSVDEWKRLGDQYFGQNSNENQEKQLIESETNLTSTVPIDGYKKYLDDFIDIEFYIPENWVVERNNLSDLENDESFKEYLNFEGIYPKGYFYGFLPNDRTQLQFITLVAKQIDENNGTEDNIDEWIDTMNTNFNIMGEGVIVTDSKIIEIDNFPFATMVYEAISDDYYSKKMIGVFGKYQTMKYSYLFQIKSDILYKEEILNHLNIITSTLNIK